MMFSVSVNVAVYFANLYTHLAISDLDIFICYHSEIINIRPLFYTKVFPTIF